MSNTAEMKSTDDQQMSTSDPRHHYAVAVRAAIDLAGRIESKSMSASTPCDDFDVRDMLGHIAAMLGRTAALGQGTDPFEVSGIITGVADDRWVAELQRRAGEVHLAWEDDTKLETLYTLPWATMPGFAVLALYTNELLVHSWDAATGARVPFEVDSETAEVTLEAMLLGLPAEGRRESFEEVFATMPPEERPDAYPFGDAVTVPADAPALHRLVAHNGRTP